MCLTVTAVEVAFGNICSVDLAKNYPPARNSFVRPML